MRNRSKWILCMGLAFTMAASVTLSGCGTGKKDSGKTEIELVQYCLLYTSDAADE